MTRENPNFVWVRGDESVMICCVDQGFSRQFGESERSSSASVWKLDSSQVVSETFQQKGKGGILRIGIFQKGTCFSFGGKKNKLLCISSWLKIFC